MLVDKERVREYYRRLKEDMMDLCHEDPEYTRLWLDKARNLRLVGAWFHYMVLIRKARDYIKKHCPCYIDRFERIRREVS